MGGIQGRIYVRIRSTSNAETQAECRGRAAIVAALMKRWVVMRAAAKNAP